MGYAPVTMRNLGYAGTVAPYGLRSAQIGSPRTAASSIAAISRNASSGRGSSPAP